MSKALANKLIEWLDASTSYPDLKEDLDRTHSNYDGRETYPKWKRFYQRGPVLMPDDTSVKDADGKPTGFKVDICSVCYDKKVEPGEIIRSGNGTSYMVQPSGALRKI